MRAYVVISQLERKKFQPEQKKLFLFVEEVRASVKTQTEILLRACQFAGFRRS